MNYLFLFRYVFLFLLELIFNKIEEESFSYLD